MILQENTKELIKLLSIALACHDIDLKYKDYLFPKREADDGVLTITLSEKYEKKIDGYITKFQNLLNEAIAQTALQSILTKLENKYNNYEWHTWTSEDILLALLQEFVRLFHEQEVGKESVGELNNLPKAA